MREYVAGGGETLARRLAERGSLMEVDQFAVATDIAAGLDFLHRQRPVPVVCGALSGATVLLRSPSSAGSIEATWGAAPTAVIALYGLDEWTRCWDSRTTLVPLAPELYKSARPKCTPASDAFAFGLVLHELTSGGCDEWASAAAFDPKRQVMPVEVARERVLSGGRPVVPSSTNVACAELMRECWHQDPHWVGLFLPRRFAQLLRRWFDCTHTGRPRARVGSTVQGTAR